MDFVSIAKIAAPIAGSLANIAVKKGFQIINKTDRQKAYVGANGIRPQMAFAFRTRSEWHPHSISVSVRKS
ncbi:MAG: hypothetical protein SWX82_18655 [Cyanobacteriota bacterium]|nr:hypothetical protein [Cyanobacteriota bacterium]